MTNRVNGLIRIPIPGNSLSVNVFKRHMSRQFLPADWPRVGTLPRIPQSVLLSSGPYVNHDSDAVDFSILYSIYTEFDRIAGTTFVRNYLVNDTAVNVAAFMDSHVNHTDFGRFDITWTHDLIGNYGNVGYFSPRTDYSVAFSDAKTIIESARPGRTYVTINDPLVSTGPRDLPIATLGTTVNAFFPDLLAINVGLPSTRAAQFEALTIPALSRFPGFAIRTFDDGTDGRYGRYLDDAIANWDPPDNLFIWSSSASAYDLLRLIINTYGNPSFSPNVVFAEREARYRSMDVDYDYAGSLAATSGIEIAGIIADHFGFTI